MKKRIITILKSTAIIVLCVGICIAIYFKLQNKASTYKENAEEKTYKNQIVQNIITENYEINNANIIEINNTITNEIVVEETKEEVKETEEIPQNKIVKDEKKKTNNQEIVQNEEPTIKESEIFEESKAETIPEIISEPISTTEPKQEPISESTSEPTLEPKPEPQPEPELEPIQEIVRCTNNNNHGMDVGNSGRWFSTRKEATDYYDNQLEYWDKWLKEDPDNRWDEYLKKCPVRYEIWDCMFCGKWTINFYYR